MVFGGGFLLYLGAGCFLQYFLLQVGFPLGSIYNRHQTFKPIHHGKVGKHRMGKLIGTTLISILWCQHSFFYRYLEYFLLVVTLRQFLLPCDLLPPLRQVFLLVVIPQRDEIAPGQPVLAPQLLAALVILVMP